MVQLSRRFQCNSWFQFFSFFPTEKRRRILILIQSNNTATIIPHLTAVNELFESLSLELVYNNDKFGIVGIYRALSTSLVEFNATFFDMLIV